MKKTSKPQFNAYMPPSFDDFFEEEVLPIEHITDSSTNNWDTANIDISYVDSNRKLISFTFDDAPAKHLENILAVFAEYNENNPDCRASATLFINGNLVTEESYSTLHAAATLGFEIGNHTQSHLDLTTLPKEILQSEIDTTDRILSRIDGKIRHLIRPPFGKCNDFVKMHASAPIINWTIDTLDWTGVTADAIYDSIFNALFPGAIILMHDGYANTVTALKRLLPDLKAAGYQVLCASALAKSNHCSLRNGSEYIRLRPQ